MACAGADRCGFGVWFARHREPRNPCRRNPPATAPSHMRAACHLKRDRVGCVAPASRGKLRHGLV